MQQRTFFDYFVITIKGIAMGAADVVPGVSGGTIAFIAGIYEELLASINKINFHSLSILRKEGVGSFWKEINGNFFVALLGGVGLSIFSLAKGITWLLEHHPILVWSFFFGLIVASVVFLAKDVQRWNLATVFMFVIGAFVAYFITTLPPFQNSQSLWFLFFSGALAICAMILPGISGAFILVLLGAYNTILEAIGSFDIKIIAVVGLGAVIGLLSFSRMLKWMFEHYKDITIALLTGFVLGSLNKIWPWKRIVSTYLDSKGNEKPFLETNVLPTVYDGNPQLWQAILLMLAGFLVVFLLEKVAVSIKK
ncbi:MAG: DUF368 domain-containing protein [Capnocytophaga sp.]|nr:DUF368 domain-containing protein [Capnocytophaga sp.]